MTTRRAYVIIALVASLALPGSLAGQGAAASPGFSHTDEWCKDATTICWNESRAMLAGLRFVFEPQLGVLVQRGRNQFDNTNFQALEKIGLATSLYGKQLGLQALFIYPSTIQFDEQSPVRVDGQTVDPDGKVDVKWGFTAGITLMDGIFSVGYGALHYDRRDFTAQVTEDNTFKDAFVYFNVQAVEAVKGALKKNKP